MLSDGETRRVPGAGAIVNWFVNGFSGLLPGEAIRAHLVRD